MPQEIPPKASVETSIEDAPSWIDENEVFSRLHHPVSDFRSSEEIEKFATHLGEDLAKCEAYPFYRDYLDGTLPTLDMLERSVAIMREKLQAEIAKEKARGASPDSFADLEAKDRVLSTRIRNIQVNVANYVQTVARFHEIKNRVRYSDSEWRVNELQRIDVERRRVHDVLLNSLRDLVVKAQEVREEGLLTSAEVALWDRTKGAKELAAEGKLVLFHPKVIADRDYIRDWAIAADMDSQLKMFAAKEEELKAQAK